MDVKEIKGGALASLAAKKEKCAGADGFDFQEMLREAQANIQEASQAAPPAAGGPEIEGAGVFPVNLMEGINESHPSRPQRVQAAERALNLLEEYQRAMDNPRVTLREIDPLVKSLAEETRGLDQWVEKLSPSDPLKKIVADLGILSSIEIGKFNRGDYV